MNGALAPVLAGAGAASAIVVAGDASPHACLLATITGVAFGTLARRAGRDGTGRIGDVTDLGGSLAFLVILIAGAFDVGRGSITGFGSGPVIIGVAIIAVGVWLRHWAVRELGASYAVRLGIGEGHALVDRGPYRWIRHPNYAALAIVAIGTAVSLSSPLAALAVLLIWLPVTLVRMEREERMLVAHYGEAYDRYRRRTWRLVPRLY